MPSIFADRETHDMAAPATAAVPDARLAMPTWFWLWLPLALYLVHYPAFAVLPADTYDEWFTSELGFTEEGTTFLLAVALLLGALCARRFAAAGEWGLAAWFGMFALGCLYFAGEEASWGQHWFGWGTAGEWAELNDQTETNLHNTEGWVGSLLDQLPRNLLTFGALIAGGIMPLVRHARGRSLEAGSTTYWILPTLVCAPSALLAALATMPEKIQEAAFGELLFDIQAGEAKELLLGFFLMIYALSVWRRLRATSAPYENA